jgi:drug/metabolite transporter (DMT)-like permease
VGALRVFLSGLVLFPLAWQSRKIYLKKHWKKFLFFASLTNLFPAILFALAQSNLTSSLAGIFNSMTPIFTFSIGVLFYSAPFKINQALGLILGIAGSVALILFSGGSLGEINFFVLFIVLATMFYGIGANYLKKNFSGIKAVAITSLSFMTVLPISFVVLLFSGFFRSAFSHPEAATSFLAILVLAVVGTAMALILYNKMIQTTSPVFASTVTYLIPIIAVLWGFLDGEVLSTFHFVGMGLIISGVYLINKTRAEISPTDDAT